MITKSDRQTAVAIVGGGASGTILAVQLAQRGIKSMLIDGSGRMGRGVAYSTTEAVHLLNVRAEGMSALAGDPNHFARRFADEGGNPRGFAQRRLFARYLGEMLDEAVADGRVELVEATATGATRKEDCWKVELDDGSTIAAGAVVLAIGNQEPAPLRAFAAVERRLIANPWGADARAAVKDLAASGEDTLLVGTGLTMVDLVLSLDAAGHRGRIVALSRRGLAPRAHADTDPTAVEWEDIPKANVRGLLRWLRRRAAQVGWRAAVDSLRPHSHPLWQSLDHDQQQRFLRHARPWWDVHRHRIAPEVADTVGRLVAEGRLQIVAGRVIAARETDGGVEVEYRRRGGQASSNERFAYVFNCTGPLHALTRSKNPLLRSLLDAGEVRPDQLDIGVKIDGTCRAGEHLWAMGPLTKGRYWEIVAVPDIREQAAEVAEDIQKELAK